MYCRTQLSIVFSSYMLQEYSRDIYWQVDYIPISDTYYVIYVKSSSLIVCGWRWSCLFAYVYNSKTLDYLCAHVTYTSITYTFTLAALKYQTQWHIMLLVRTMSSCTVPQDITRPSRAKSADQYDSNIDSTLKTSFLSTITFMDYITNNHSKIISGFSSDFWNLVLD